MGRKGEGVRGGEGEKGREREGEREPLKHILSRHIATITTEQDTNIITMHHLTQV